MMQWFSPSAFMTPPPRATHRLPPRLAGRMTGGDAAETSQATASRRLFSFDEARRLARGHGFASKEEFLDYSCPGAYQLPKDADVVWREEWRGWEDFLGVALAFREGRDVARALAGVDTEEEYLTLIKSKPFPMTTLPVVCRIGQI